MKTATEIEAAVLKSLTGTLEYFNYRIVAETQSVRKQNRRGKPGKNTKYEEKTKTIYPTFRTYNYCFLNNLEPFFDEILLF